MGAESRRLYVGNLFPEVTDDDIKKRFSKFGSVTKVEIKSKRDIDGEVTETFAFIDLGSGDRGLADCIAGLNNTKWKGKVMKLQQAKESFMERLARERRERESEGGSGVGAQAPHVEVEAAAPPKPLPPPGKQDRGLDGGRLAGGKLRKRDFTEEQEDFKGFNIKKKPSSDTKYDPMGIFKAKLAGDDEVGRVEGPVEASEGDGKVKDGMVIFGEEEGAGGEEELFNVQKMKVSKVYHSSSEEDEQPKSQVETKKLVKKKVVKEDKSSAEFKAKMTERFLMKQKLIKEEKAQQEASKSSQKGSRNKDGKYYSDSDDELDEGIGKGKDALQKLRSFAGDLWKDSDEEDESAKSMVTPNDAHEEGSDDEEDESDDEDDSSSDEEEEEAEQLTKKRPLFDPSSMVRYDPLSEGQENFLRNEEKEAHEDKDVEHLKEEKTTSSYSVTSDLKAAFNSSKGFSFGFGGNKDAASESAKSKQIQATDDWDAIEEAAEDGVSMEVAKKSSDDVAASFGRQLRVKGVDKAKNPFFFTPEDSRLEAGLDFFFNQEVDMDQLRQDWDSKGRAVLVEILKKTGEK